MLSITIPAEDLSYFQSIVDENKDNCLVIHSHGMDMQQTVQITIDLSGILQAVLPTIIAAVEVYMYVKLQKKANENAQEQNRIAEQSAQQNDFFRFSSKVGDNTFVIMHPLDQIDEETIKKDRELLRLYKEGILKNDED